MTIRTNFLNFFWSSCGGECPSTANFCYQCGQQLNLSQVLNKAARPVDKGKLLKGYFHRGYPNAAIVSLVEKRHGARMHVRTLKRKLRKRPRKLRPVRRCFVSTFKFIICSSYIILNFIYVRKATRINYLKFARKWQSTFISIFLNTKLRNMQQPHLLT